jgi:lipopolysaccharide export system permease protein
MKIIDRYILRELIPPFFLGILIFTFVLLMSQILRLVELIVNKGVPTVTVGKLIFFLLPSILVLTVPMSVFLTCIVTFGRWSADNELTAVKSGGVGLHRLSLPVIAFSLAIYLLASYLIIHALPAGNQAFRRKMFEIVRTKASIGLQEKVFNDDFEGLIIYIDHIPPTDDPVMKGVIITDYRPEKRNPPQDPLTIIAEEGWLVIDEAAQRVVFRLRNGGMHSMSRDMLKYQKIDFRIHDLQLSLTDTMAGPINVPKGLREMTLAELRAKAAEYQAQGVRSNGPLVEIHKKFAIPFAALIFGFLGISMGVIFHRGEKLVSFAVSIAIAVIYYVFLLAGEPLGKQGKISPFLAMWSANIFFATLTVFLFLKVMTEKTVPELIRRIGGFPLRLPRALSGRRRP